MSLFRVCVLLRKMRQWRLSEDGIKFSLATLRSGDASSVVRGRGGVSPANLVGFGCWWSSVDPFGSSFCSFIYMLDPFDLYFFFIDDGCCSVALVLRAVAEPPPGYPGQLPGLSHAF
jgi:hypothetical protein